MTEYVCTQLSDLNGVQTCTAYAESAPLLPAMTYTEANMIGGAIMGVLAFVWVINQIKYAIKRI